MLRFALASLAVCLPLASVQAHAAEAPGKLELTENATGTALTGAVSTRAERQLASGQRIPVMVMLNMAPTQDGKAFAGVDETSRASISAARDSVLQDAFPLGIARSISAPDRAIDEEGGPVVYAEFRVTPAFAMLANAEEIQRLTNLPGVASVTEDALSPPILGESNAVIGSPTLWAQNVEGTGTSVAILDTGIENEHPMTASAIVGSACFNTTVIGQGSTSFCPTGDETLDVSGNSAGDSCVEDNVDATNGVDGCFHGTHVGSTAAGRTVNTSSQGLISGVARQSGLVAVNVFSRFDNDENCNGPDPCVLSYNSDQLAALEWLFDNRVALDLAAVNMSLGGGENASACDGNSLTTVIGQLRDNGVATVIASGNDGFTNAVSSPGCISDAITVGATTKADEIASFSNSSDLVDFLAPGVQILAAFQTEEPEPGNNCTINNSTPNNEGFCHWFSNSNGTSMATPHVAGAFALLRGAFPNATVDEIETALAFTGVQLLDSRNNIVKPRIQVDAAHGFLANGGAVVADVLLDPSESFTAVGALGDDASAFGSKQYSLDNQVGSSRSYTLTASEDWIELTNTSGTVPGNGSRNFTVSVDPTGQSVGSYQGTVTVTINSQTLNIPIFMTITSPGPANNTFANALPLIGPAPDTTGSNQGADKETGEPNHGNAGGASVWWRWTAPFSGTAVANTEGSNYDTTLAAYTGDTVDDLTQLAQNDDINLGVILQSQITFNVTEGTTYYIAVDGFGGDTGNIALAIGPSGAPSNDSFDNAVDIATFRGSATGVLVNASRQAGEPNVALTSSGSIWYRFTAPGDGPWRFALDGTDGPASVAAYTGSAVNGLTELASAQDDGRDGATQSALSPSITIDLDSGQVAYIAVGRSETDTERSVVSWARTFDTAELFSAVLPYARSVPVGSTATAFVSVFNNGDRIARNCVVEGPGLNNFPGETVFQTTDPATNALTGSPNTGVDIASSATQTFVFGITPNAPIAGQEIALVTRCDNAQTPVGALGVNTFILNAEAVATPDLIAISATVTNDGIVEVPSNTGIEVFTVAAVNIGTAGQITATPEFGDLDVTATICETGGGGACLADPAAQVVSDFAANETRFFSIFVTPNSPIAFDPANNRIRVLFRDSATSATYGGTNVAVRSE